MPFQTILQEMLARPGVEGVVFLDSEGEAILSFGKEDPEKLKLLGAYQSIVLSRVGKMGWPNRKSVVTICDHKTILTRHLKDGYFVSVVFSKDLNFARAEFIFREAYEKIEQEL